MRDVIVGHGETLSKSQYVIISISAVFIPVFIFEGKMYDTREASCQVDGRMVGYLCAMPCRALWWRWQYKLQWWTNSKIKSSMRCDSFSVGPNNIVSITTNHAFSWLFNLYVLNRFGYLANYQYGNLCVTNLGISNAKR